VIAAYDSEWERNKVDARFNNTLAYQWSALCQTAPGKWVMCEGIHFTKESEEWKRLSSAQYLGIVLQSLGFGYKTAMNLPVLLLGHFTLADLSQFADRKDFNQRFQEVRHTLVTLRGSVTAAATFGQRHSAKVQLALRDTMLLAPQKQESLEAIGAYTQHKKILLDSCWKSRMGEYLTVDRLGFIAYAITDCRVALEYFINVVDRLAELIGVDTIPLTLSSATVTGYVRRLGSYTSPAFMRIFGLEAQQYVNAVGHEVTTLGKCAMRFNNERKAGESYMGGLNTAYYIKAGKCRPDQIILDIDFSSAYPTAFAAVPSIDWFVRPVYIDNLRQLLAHINPHNLAALGYVPNILGFVDFEFPEGTMHPCLPVRYGNGLIYPLKGQTYCTGIEMDLALRMRCKLKLEDVSYFPILKHEDNTPLLPYANYLGMLVTERRKHAPGTLMNMLYKEMANSLYGKTAQGIVERTCLNHYNEENGSVRKKRLPETRITVPHFAALCTGIVRAALSTVVAGLSMCPGFLVLSATTDGCMLAAPRRFDPEELPVENGKVNPTSLDLLALYPEIRNLERYPAIQALGIGGKNLHQTRPWAEVKHIGDTADTMRTRVYSLSYKGVEQHVAHTGIDTENESLAELHYTAGLVTQIGKRLPSAREITTGEVEDFVEIEYERTVNTDYDYKRYLHANGLTQPFATKAEFLAHRDAVSRLRKKEGVRATQERVVAKVAASQAGMQARTGKGETSADVYRRYVHQAIAAGLGEWVVFNEKGKYAKGKDIAAMLGINYQNQYKNYKRRPFERGRFPDCELLKSVAIEELRKVGMTLTPRMYADLTTR
jgi:hypothetical protein